MACIKRNRAQPRRTSSPANAMSIRDPVPGRRSSRSIFYAVITKRAAATPTIAVPRTINASPAMLPNFWPGNDRVRPAKDGAANSRNRSNFSTRKPKAITAMDVRTQARNVRSFAEWSLKFLIILSANMNPRNGTINIKRIGAQWDKVLRLTISNRNADGFQSGRRGKSGLLGSPAH
jgi:hypothetical protein